MPIYVVNPKHGQMISFEKLQRTLKSDSDPTPFPDPKDVRATVAFPWDDWLVGFLLIYSVADLMGTPSNSRHRGALASFSTQGVSIRMSKPIGNLHKSLFEPNRTLQGSKILNAPGSDSFAVSFRHLELRGELKEEYMNVGDSKVQDE